jgi:drug/metabolite transporter superfamily protein YnfA
MNDPKMNEFERAAAKEANRSFFGELWGFLRENKKWWLLPILIMLLIFGLLVVLSGTGLAPFIYTLF